MGRGDPYVFSVNYDMYIYHAVVARTCVPNATERHKRNILDSTSHRDANRESNVKETAGKCYRLQSITHAFAKSNKWSWFMHYSCLVNGCNVTVQLQGRDDLSVDSDVIITLQTKTDQFFCVLNIITLIEHISLSGTGTTFGMHYKFCNVTVRYP